MAKVPLDIIFEPDKLIVMKALSQIAKDALDLPPRQRVTLARILLDSSESGPASVETEAVWEEEICRRIQAIKGGTAESREMDDVFSDLDRRYTA